MEDFEFYLIVIVVVTLVAIFGKDQLPKKYRQRNCMGKGWKTAFPDATNDDSRAFLLIFVDAFAFSKHDKLKFSPDDKLIDIYKQLYPHKWQADAMEFESLEDDLFKQYEVKLSAIWHDDLTLGQLFKVVV